MPLARGLDGCWVVPPEVARRFVPILRREIDALLRQGVVIDPALLRELSEGERAAASPDETGQIPDIPSDKIDCPRSVGSVKGLRKAAEIAGMSRSTLADRVRSGAIPARRRGHVLMFDVADLKGATR